jgi:hypothetical protein
MSETKKSPVIAWLPIGISVLSLGVSATIAFRNWNANRASLSAVALPTRTHTQCDRTTGRFQNRTIVPFLISNSGGREAALVGLSRIPGQPAVTLIDEEIPDGTAPSPAPRSLSLVNSLEMASQGFDSPSWEIDKTFEPARSLFFEENQTLEQHRPVLNVPVAPGKSVFLVFGLTSEYRGAGPRFMTVSLSAEFADLQQVALTTNGVVHEAVIRGGRCPPVGAQ